MSKDGFIDTMASITALSIQQSVTMLAITIGIAYLGVAHPEDLYASVAQMLTVFVNISVRELASSAKAESWGYVLLTFHLYALIVFQVSHGRWGERAGRNESKFTSPHDCCPIPRS